MIINNEFIVCMPTAIKLAKGAKGKMYNLNLNQYHVWHHHVRNALKQKYKELALILIPNVDFEYIELYFTMYKGSNRRIDRANVLCIHEKFFCDALTESGVIPDDNDKYIIGTHYSSGEIDRENPHVEIRVKALSKEQVLQKEVASRWVRY
jgi:hypothetical protein